MLQLTFLKCVLCLTNSFGCIRHVTVTYLVQLITHASLASFYGPNVTRADPDLSLIMISTVYASVTFDTFYWYDFSGIVGGSKLRRMCLHSFDSAISFNDRAGLSLQRPCGDRTETAQSSCNLHFLRTKIAQCQNDVLAGSLRLS